MADTNMLPEVVLETTAKKDKKPFGETFVGGLFAEGGLFANLAAGFANMNAPKTIGQPSTTPIKQNYTPQYQPQVIMQPPPPPKFGGEKALMIGLGVVSVSVATYFIVKANKKSSKPKQKPLNGVRGKRKATPKKHDTITL